MRLLREALAMTGGMGGVKQFHFMVNVIGRNEAISSPRNECFAFSSSRSLIMRLLREALAMTVGMVRNEAINNYFARGLQ
jgi:hypothetical protein